MWIANSWSASPMGHCHYTPVKYIFFSVICVCYLCSFMYSGSSDFPRSQKYWVCLMMGSKQWVFDLCYRSVECSCCSLSVIIAQPPLHRPPALAVCGIAARNYIHILVSLRITGGQHVLSGLSPIWPLNAAIWGGLGGTPGPRRF